MERLEVLTKFIWGGIFFAKWKKWVETIFSHLFFLQQNKR